MEVDTAINVDKCIKFTCQVCFSANRNTYRLNALKEIYYKLCEIPYEESLNVYLCWECLALLKKIKWFKDKAQNSQSILKNGLRNQFPQVFTSLSLSKTSVTDYFEKIKKEDVDTKEGLLQETKNEPEMTIEDIKHEMETNDANDYDTIDFDQVDEINDENVSEALLKHIKKERNLKKAKYYKLTYLSCKGDIVKKIAIDPDDVQGWVERERNSEYFKNLKKKCDLCFSKLRAKVTLEEHNEKYHVKRRKCRFPCDICQTYLLSRQAVNAHIKHHYYSRQCGVCGYECYTEANMRDHIEGHKKIVQCLSCDATFKNLRLFFSHNRNMHKKYICDYCNKVHVKKHSLEKHIIRVHIKPTVQCEVCNSIFKNKHSLKAHIAMLHTKAPSEASFCVQCNIQFDNIQLFRRHVLTAVAHINEWTMKPKKAIVPCTRCANTYRSRYAMMNHYRYVHLNASKYGCNECNITFLNRTKMVNHQKTVHEGYVPVRNKICTICERGFTNNKILRHHIRTHTGERPYECTYCDSKFAQRTAMLTHIKHIHLKAKRKHL